MTGHGRGGHLQNGYKKVVELAGVNWKQLKIGVSLPREFKSLEGEIQERLQRRLSRGRASARVAVWNSKGEDFACMVLSETLARECAAQLRELAAAVGIDGTLRIDLVARIPGVLRVEAGAGDAKQVRILIQRALDKALAGMLAIQQAEGEICARICIGGWFVCGGRRPKWKSGRRRCWSGIASSCWSECAKPILKRRRWTRSGC